MDKNFLKLLSGYQEFREKYATGDASIMKFLSYFGQQPEVMVIACCDSRVDPALILQCDPGELFVVRNVANIVPPFEKDNLHHGTSAALEFGINFLEVKHLILLGHSQCGGIQALLKNNTENDFITNWVSQIKNENLNSQDADEHAKAALHQSYENCLTFPWLAHRLAENKIFVHRWFFDIKEGKIFAYDATEKNFKAM